MMNEGSITDSSTSDDTKTNSPHLDKMENLPPLPIITSNDDDEDEECDDDDLSYQLTPREDDILTITSSLLSEKFYDVVLLSESGDSISFRNSLSLYGSKSPQKIGEKKRSLFLCCFCPTDASGLDNSDDCGDDYYGYNNILDFTGCNVDLNDLDIDASLGNNENLISFDSRLEEQRIAFDTASTFHEGDFLSCCDTNEFDVDIGDLDSPSVIEEPNEPFEEFSRHIRVCNLNVHDMNAIQDSPCENGVVETSMDTAQTNTTLRNDGSGEDESIEAILSTSSIHEKEGIQGPKLTFLELTNRYDRNAEESKYHATVIQAMNSMVQVGLGVATGVTNQSNSISIRWKEEGSTNKILNKIRNGGDSKWYSNPDLISLLETDTLVWSGLSTAKDGNNMEQSNYGAKLTYFKARGIIPGISPRDLAELILDSSRVKLYNKWTCGRDDLHVLQEPMTAANGLYGDGCLKVVQSETAIPFSSNTLKMVNFLHGRPLKLHHDDLCSENAGVEIDCNDTPNAYIIASRSVYTEDDRSKDESSNNTQATPGSRNEMIMGVNVFREVPGHPDKTDLLTISQANSSAIPSFLAHKAGLMGANDFIKSLRGINLDDL